MSGNDWKRGLERIAPGLYVDKAGALHIDNEELLRAHGYAVNEHNSEILRQAAAKISAEQGAGFTNVDHQVCGHCGAAITEITAARCVCPGCGRMVSAPAKHVC